MYYGTFTVKTLPGKRFAGVEHLKKLAAMVEKKYDLKAQVLGNVTGAIYENHFVVTYENLAQSEEFGEKLNSDEEFLSWFGESTDLVDWNGARQSLFQVF